MLDIPIISSSGLKSGLLKDSFPEVYDLKNTTENSKNFHKNDNVFNHTLRVLKALETLMRETRPPELDQPFGLGSRKKLLLIAALLHDIGKKETIVVIDGYTKCPHHEIVGSKKAKTILKRLNLDAKDEHRIVRLIKDHQALFNIVSSSNPTIDDDVHLVMKKKSSYFLELILLTIADIQGSQLNEANREEFDYRINYLKRLLAKSHT